MKVNRIVLLVFFLFSLLGMRTMDDFNTSNKWVIRSGSFLKVSGSTNVNSFCCEIKNYCSPDTLCFYPKSKQNLISGELVVAISSFDCHHSIIKKDMQKTLLADTYQNMYIKFLSLNKIPSNTKHHETIEGAVEITLAGTTELFNVNFTFLRNDRNELNMMGTRTIRFSDFNIQPPKKLRGMIQTKDELCIEFDLKLKAL